MTKALRARKNEKMQRCEAIRQQHEQLRRGDGADQSSSNQVGHRFSDTIFFSCCKKKQLLILAPTLSVASGREAGQGPAPGKRPALAAGAAEHLRGRETEQQQLL